MKIGETCAFVAMHTYKTQKMLKDETTRFNRERTTQIDRTSVWQKSDKAMPGFQFAALSIKLRVEERQYLLFASLFVCSCL